MTATPTTDVAALVLARLQEDEAAARAAIDPDGWYSSPDGRWCLQEVPYEGEWPRNPDTDDAVLWADSDWCMHANRHDPARVLAQVAALRAVVELHQRDREGECAACGEGDYGCGPAGDPGYYRGTDWPCPTLRALASIWRGAPGWQEAWG